MPLAFVPGEAFQFDWSEDWAIIDGERTKLQVALLKLSYSRAFTVGCGHPQVRFLRSDLGAENLGRKQNSFSQFGRSAG